MSQPTDITTLDPKRFIIIKGARMHNLKNIDVAIPRNKMVVITGLSGSGKSSLAFDTLYAEGQRRYVESLSAYARQFLGKLEKPQVDYIKGISPAIAIEQKVISRNPRSTVGTITEIYDYFKLLFARIGKTYSPVSGRHVKRNTVTDVVDFLNSQKAETRALVLSRIDFKKDRTFSRQLELLSQQGFSRVLLNETVKRISDVIDADTSKGEIYLLVDRLVVQPGDEDFSGRASDSVQTAFYEGHGECLIWTEKEDGGYDKHTFSNRFELDGITFEEPGVNLFTFNNPIGACKTCEGFGSVI
jgi:excinuclease ABC subunit A